MSRAVRIAVSEALHAAEAVPAGTLQPMPIWVVPAEPEAARQRAAWERLWLERRRGRGGSSGEAEAALAEAPTRAMLALLAQECDAAVLSEADAGWQRAWALLEPAAPGGVCADLWIAELPGAATVGWCAWPGSEQLSRAADALATASATLSQIAGAPAVPVLLDFSNGRDHSRPQLERLAATLAARRPGARLVQIYSPFFFEQGQLRARNLLAAIGRQAPGTLLLCGPRLHGAELAAAIEAEGGSWAGALAAGAERPAARLCAQATPAQVAATIGRLARLGMGLAG